MKYDYLVFGMHKCGGKGLVYIQSARFLLVYTVGDLFIIISIYYSVVLKSWQLLNGLNWNHTVYPGSL